MDKKGINRNELCRSIDSRYEVVNKWYNGTIEKIDTDVLARICYVLACKPEDIIHYNYPKSE
ncbi:MAG: helix-turn-helix transcriptional regulator [Lachnospiraceae bacterium]|nr:helix-turn-helix transcriptional regulator [Lachnospiraceae bacterium]